MTTTSHNLDSQLMTIISHSFDPQPVLEYIQSIYNQPYLEVIETSVLPLRVIDRALSIRFNQRDTSGKLQPKYLNKFWIGVKTDSKIKQAFIGRNPSELVQGNIYRFTAWLEQQSNLGNAVTKGLKL
jgi:hypothetical protein